MMDGIEETATEFLRRRVQEFHYARGPYGQDKLVEWLAHHPAKVREAIFMIIDGNHLQNNRSRQKAQARRKGSA